MNSSFSGLIIIVIGTSRNEIKEQIKITVNYDDMPLEMMFALLFALCWRSFAMEGGEIASVDSHFSNSERKVFIEFLCK